MESRAPVAAGVLIVMGCGMYQLCTSTRRLSKGGCLEPLQEQKPEAKLETKRVLAVRHCQDEADPEKDSPRKRQKRQGRHLGSRFRQWHTPAFRATRRGMDPCLTDTGVKAAGTGVEDEAERLRLNEIGYGGVAGGLEPVGEAFAPELIVCSPLSRAVQTALVMFDSSDAPLVIHAAIKEIKDDYTAGGRFPDGKPGCRGLTRSALDAALAAHPRKSGACASTALLSENWFDANESHGCQTARLKEFERWLLARPESRIAVVSHGGCLRHWLQRDIAHGQYCRAELSTAGWLHSIDADVGCRRSKAGSNE